MPTMSIDLPTPAAASRRSVRTASSVPAWPMPNVLPARSLMDAMSDLETSTYGIGLAGAETARKPVWRWRAMATSASIVILAMSPSRARRAATASGVPVVGKKSTCTPARWKYPSSLASCRTEFGTGGISFSVTMIVNATAAVGQAPSARINTSRSKRVRSRAGTGASRAASLRLGDGSRMGVGGDTRQLLTARSRGDWTGVLKTTTAAAFCALFLRLSDLTQPESAEA